MIELTRLNKQKNEKFLLNCEIIEIIEEKPDTTIRLTNGKHYVVNESSARCYQRLSHINVTFSAVNH